MLSDKRVLLLLQRGLLACFLAAPGALLGCGGSDPKTEGDDNPVGDGSDGDGTDGDGTDGDGTDDTAAKDAGTKPKDSGVKVTPVPASDAGVATTKDSGVVKGGLDGGGGGGTPDGGGTVVPPTGDDPTTASATAMGPYNVKTYTTGYADSQAYADATMHYPEGVAGPLPAITIVPGFLSAQSTIQMWGPFLASHGIITFTIGTNSPTDQPDARSTALLGAIETIKSENLRADSPIKGKVDLSRLGIGGWSMGGGGALITLNTHPEFKAAIAFCPWDPGATFPKISTPIIFLAAANDQLAVGQSQPFYESIPASVPKLLWERSDADHFANDPSYEMGAMGRYGLSFLKVYLEGDARYKQFLTVKAPNASDWRTTVQ